MLIRGFKRREHWEVSHVAGYKLRVEGDSGRSDGQIRRIDRVVAGKPLSAKRASALGYCFVDRMPHQR